MRQLIAAHRTARRVAAASLIAGALVVLGCGETRTSVDTSHTIMFQVQDVSMAPIANVSVTAWIIDVDLPADQRVPIELGTAPTDAQGQVRFSYASDNPPYVCGWEVWSAGGLSKLAEHPPVASDNLSPNGYAVVLIP